MRKIKVSTGVFWVEIPEANLFILCGCPADSIKHLMEKGFISTVEKNGVTYETGPNAILLSDVSMQKERFSNLAEFPLLHMLYRQGMILPNHPNNTGIKPLIIGIEDQVKAQKEYFYRGNYGLTTIDEIMKSGVPENHAHEMLKLKLKFAFGRFQKTEDIIETRIVSVEPVEIRNGVFLKRKGLNLYEFSLNGTSVDIDLNISEEYEAPYQLGYYMVNRDYFSIIHAGEGDGWDFNRPCMSSILIFQGRIYLIDAGPNLIYSLQSLGIGVSEIEGIFHTHAHDDHFIGLTDLIRSDHRIKYFSTPLVRNSMVKKLLALTAMQEKYFDKFFEFNDLHENEWNNIDGLEVMPVYSPHPVETNIFFFRTLWGKYKSYAHFAEIVALDVLKGMISDTSSKTGVSQEYYNRIKEVYLTPVDLKKIDAGGGLIHGNAEDFREDNSKKIILSHSAVGYTDRQKEIGSSTSFGMTDILIPAEEEYIKVSAFQNLKIYYPNVPSHELRMLLNCPVVVFNPGSILIKQGELNENILYVLSGVLEFIAADYGVNNKLTAGSIVGEISALRGTASIGTYRAISYVKALEIPNNLYIEFLKRNGIYENIFENIDMRIFLQNSWLFGERISCPTKSLIASHITSTTFSEDQSLPVNDGTKLLLLECGEIEVYGDDKIVKVLTPGNFYGEEQIIYGPMSQIFKARVTKKSKVNYIPSELFENIPIVQLKLLGTLERCLRIIGLHLNI